MKARQIFDVYLRERLLVVVVLLEELLLEELLLDEVLLLEDEEYVGYFELVVVLVDFTVREGLIF